MTTFSFLNSLNLLLKSNIKKIRDKNIMFNKDIDEPITIDAGNRAIKNRYNLLLFKATTNNSFRFMNCFILLFNNVNIFKDF